MSTKADVRHRCANMRKIYISDIAIQFVNFIVGATGNNQRQ